MQRLMIAFTTFVLLVMIGCSSSGSSGPLMVAYNSVYGINALSTDENISLHVGDEVIEPVIPYDQNASILEKAVGSDNGVYYSVGSTGDYGFETLQNSRTYFYAATDCNDSSGRVEKLLHLVESDMQIKITNTSSDIALQDELNISINGTQINGDIPACVITAMPDASTQDQNVSVNFTDGSFSVWKKVPSDVNVSVTVVVYGTPPQEAAIILLPRLTSDAL